MWNYADPIRSVLNVAKVERLRGFCLVCEHFVCELWSHFANFYTQISIYKKTSIPVLYLYQYEQAEIKHKKRVSLFGGTINIYIYRFISLNFWGFACSVIRDNSCTNYEVIQLNRAENTQIALQRVLFLLGGMLKCLHTHTGNSALCALKAFYHKLQCCHKLTAEHQPTTFVVLLQLYLQFAAYAYLLTILNMCHAKSKSAGWTHSNLHACKKYEMFSWSFPNVS